MAGPKRLRVLVSLCAQAAILSLRPLIYLNPDSPTNLMLGERLFRHPAFTNLCDSVCTPGDPALLGLA
jgi:hypothetical protein